MAFECGICTSNFNSGERQPLILECGHTFCRECLRCRLGPQRWCALCRHPIRKAIDELPRNYALENAMEASNLPLVELLERWGIANAERMMVRPDQLQLNALLSRKGNSGEVWRGTLWGKQVAVKLVRIEDVDERLIDCLRREVAVLLHTTGECKHVCIYKGFCVKGSYFAIAMKLYASSLAQRISRAPGRRLPLPLAVRWASDVAKGLVELHRLGVVVADLKPDNVLIDDDLGDAVIADFGISSVVAGTIGGGGGGAAAGAESSGSIRGTPNYMSPEQFGPRQHHTIKVDIWGFACTFLHMVTGAPPWAGDSVLQICTAVGVGRRSPLVPADLPAEIRDLIRACLSPDPARRPLAPALLRALQAVAPRLEPVAAGLRHAAAQRTQLLRAARNVLAGLQDDVGQLVREMDDRDYAATAVDPDDASPMSSSDEAAAAAAAAVVTPGDCLGARVLGGGVGAATSAAAGGLDGGGGADFEGYLQRLGMPLLKEASQLAAPSAPPMGLGGYEDSAAGLDGVWGQSGASTAAATSQLPPGWPVDPPQPRHHHHQQQQQQQQQQRLPKLNLAGVAAAPPAAAVACSQQLPLPSAPPPSAFAAAAAAPLSAGRLHHQGKATAAAAAAAVGDPQVRHHPREDSSACSPVGSAGWGSGRLPSSGFKPGPESSAASSGAAGGFAAAAGGGLSAAAAAAAGGPVGKAGSAVVRLEMVEESSTLLPPRFEGSGGGGEPPPAGMGPAAAALAAAASAPPLAATAAVGTGLAAAGVLQGAAAVAAAAAAARAGRTRVGQQPQQQQQKQKQKQPVAGRGTLFGLLRGGSGRSKSRAQSGGGEEAGPADAAAAAAAPGALQPPDSPGSHSPGFWKSAIRSYSPDKKQRLQQQMLASRLTSAGSLAAVSSTNSMGGGAAAVAVAAAAATGKAGGGEGLRRLFGAGTVDVPAGMVAAAAAAAAADDVGPEAIEQQQEEQEDCGGQSPRTTCGSPAGKRPGSVACGGRQGALDCKAAAPSPLQCGDCDLDATVGDEEEQSASPLRAHARRLPVPRAGAGSACGDVGLASAGPASPQHPASLCGSPGKKGVAAAACLEAGAVIDQSAADAGADPGGDATCIVGAGGALASEQPLQSGKPACLLAARARARAAAAAAMASPPPPGSEALAAAEGDNSGCGGNSSPVRQTHGAKLVEASRLESEAKAHAAAGRLEAAEGSARKALAILQSAAGPKHPNTVAAMGRLAAVLNRQGKGVEAEALFKQVLQHREALLGRSHPQVATTLSNLATCQYTSGAFEAAEASFRAVLALRKKAFGDDHTDTAAATNNLALCLGRLGRHSEAEQLYRTALAVRASALGPEHPDVAVTAHNLGVCLSNLGQHAEALAFHKQALHVREQAAAAAGREGGSSEATRAAEVLASHRAAAACLRRLGCEGQAEPHLTAILSAARAAAAAAAAPGRARDAALLEVAAAAEDVARCLAQQGQHARAEEAWWEALEARREAVGGEHASVLEVEEQLRRCLEAQ